MNAKDMKQLCDHLQIESMIKLDNICELLKKELRSVPTLFHHKLTTQLELMREFGEINEAISDLAMFGYLTLMKDIYDEDQHSEEITKSN